MVSVLLPTLTSACAAGVCSRGLSHNNPRHCFSSSLHSHWETLAPPNLALGRHPQTWFRPLSLVTQTPSSPHTPSRIFSSTLKSLPVNVCTQDSPPALTPSVPPQKFSQGFLTVARMSQLPPLLSGVLIYEWEARVSSHLQMLPQRVLGLSGMNEKLRVKLFQIC